MCSRFLRTKWRFSVCVCVCVSLTHNQGYVAALRTHLTCNILLPSLRNVSYLRSSTEQTPGLNVHVAHWPASNQVRRRSVCVFLQSV